ncbi:MAG: hypothetical protein GTO45_09965 [Candidatus Aminicenantes bacterium]|nr:hypothetical protein [Candidatus Aminicenantes bacterium]NIM79134.1 hypothetical protein [Candidatus Aminicenantes bacterium]NIN18419.1 hypothetical protein [Candidatus Aminicenantes bacterium]NIN42307.1 hypothetical protein [Candidatus Aminicenantes bacterium]NIN85073.1 hypothetical protein [Candidatus Aminicenantes bacterium]
MIRINLIIEDILSEEVLRVILEQSSQKFEVIGRFPDLGRRSSSSGFGYIKSRLKGFNNAAKGMPFLVLTDLDREECAPKLIREWLPFKPHPNLIFRVAKREVESWVMADRNAFAHFLGIPISKIPLNIDDEVMDPKAFLVKMARKSRDRAIRNAIVPKHAAVKVGPDYNGKLISFVQDKWDLNRAAQHSDSLKRAANAINNFQPILTEE